MEAEETAEVRRQKIMNRIRAIREQQKRAQEQRESEDRGSDVAEDTSLEEPVSPPSSSSPHPRSSAAEKRHSVDDDEEEWDGIAVVPSTLRSRESSNSPRDGRKSHESEEYIEKEQKPEYEKEKHGKGEVGQPKVETTDEEARTEEEVSTGGEEGPTTDKKMVSGDIGDHDGVDDFEEPLSDDEQLIPDGDHHHPLQDSTVGNSSMQEDGEDVEEEGGEEGMGNISGDGHSDLGVSMEQEEEEEVHSDDLVQRNDELEQLVREMESRLEESYLRLNELEIELAYFKGESKEDFRLVIAERLESKYSELLDAERKRSENVVEKFGEMEMIRLEEMDRLSNELTEQEEHIREKYKTLYEDRIAQKDTKITELRDQLASKDQEFDQLLQEVEDEKIAIEKSVREEMRKHLQEEMEKERLTLKEAIHNLESQRHDMQMKRLQFEKTHNEGLIVQHAAFEKKLETAMTEERARTQDLFERMEEEKNQIFLRLRDKEREYATLETNIRSQCDKDLTKALDERNVSWRLHVQSLEGKLSEERDRLLAYEADHKKRVMDLEDSWMKRMEETKEEERIKRASMEEEILSLRSQLSQARLEAKEHEVEMEKSLREKYEKINAEKTKKIQDLEVTLESLKRNHTSEVFRLERLRESDVESARKEEREFLETRIAEEKHRADSIWETLKQERSRFEETINGLGTSHQTELEEQIRSLQSLHIAEIATEKKKSESIAAELESERQSFIQRQESEEHFVKSMTEHREAMIKKESELASQREDSLSRAVSEVLDAMQQESEKMHHLLEENQARDISEFDRRFHQILGQFREWTEGYQQRSASFQVDITRRLDVAGSKITKTSEATSKFYEGVVQKLDSRGDEIENIRKELTAIIDKLRQQLVESERECMNMKQERISDEMDQKVSEDRRKLEIEQALREKYETMQNEFRQSVITEAQEHAETQFKERLSLQEKFAQRVEQEVRTSEERMMAQFQQIMHEREEQMQRELQTARDERLNVLQEWNEKIQKTIRAESESIVKHETSIFERYQKIMGSFKTQMEEHVRQSQEEAMKNWEEKEKSYEKKISEVMRKHIVQEGRLRDEHSEKMIALRSEFEKEKNELESGHRRRMEALEKSLQDRWKRLSMECTEKEDQLRQHYRQLMEEEKEFVEEFQRTFLEETIHDAEILRGEISTRSSILSSLHDGNISLQEGPSPSSPSSPPTTSTLTSTKTQDDMSSRSVSVLMSKRIEELRKVFEKDRDECVEGESGNEMDRDATMLFEEIVSPMDNVIDHLLMMEQELSEKEVSRRFEKKSDRSDISDAEEVQSHADSVEWRDEETGKDENDEEDKDKGDEDEDEDENEDEDEEEDETDEKATKEKTFRSDKKGDVSIVTRPKREELKRLRTLIGFCRELRAKELEAIVTYEDTIRDKYSKENKQVRAALGDATVSLREELERTREREESIKKKYEQRRSRFQIAMHKWKSDYMKHVHELYEKRLLGLEDQVSKEMEERERERSMLREFETIQFLLKSKEASVSKNVDSLRAAREKEEKAIDQRWEESCKRRIQQSQDKLRHYWDALECRVNDIAPFMEKITATNGDLEKIAVAYEHEARKLADRVELTEMVMRLEVSKIQKGSPIHKLREMANDVAHRVEQYQKMYGEDFVFDAKPYTRESALSKIKH